MSARMIGRTVAGMVLALAIWPAMAEPLTIVDVAAPAINRVFDKSCEVTVTDSVDAIAIPALSGRAVLQSRTYAGAAGAPAAGLTGNEFRVDLTQATASLARICVTRLKLDVGPLSRLRYPGVGPADVFVINSGGLGTVGLASADRTEDAVTFAFWKAVCAGAGSAKGGTSHFFGFAAATAPKQVAAQVQLDTGQILNVAARTPAP